MSHMSTLDHPRTSEGLLVGTAGWSLPKVEQTHFPGEGSHLERYARRFAAAEVNSSFHRSHRPGVWERWRDAVPADFRFSVKMPKTISHEARLVDVDALLGSFVEEVSHLGTKLGCILVQLPPSLTFDATVAGQFFASCGSKSLRRLLVSRGMSVGLKLKRTPF
jgi:uncharacterized protein YecE (DUF72 family)